MTYQLRRAPEASTGPEILAGLNVDGSSVSWMEANWMFISWAIFLFGSGFLAGRYQSTEPGTREEHLWCGWLSVIMYCLHQSEEHAYDIRGWRYSFVPSLNFGPISDMHGDEVFIDPKMTLYINTVAIWIGFGGCMMFASLSRDNRYLLCGYLNWGTAIVNGICGHFIPAILTITYNPGVVQSSIMAPLGIFIIRKSGHTMLCIANGIIFHAALIASVNVIFRFHTPETTTTIAFNLVAGLVLPLVISKYVVAQQSNKNRHQ